MKSIALRIFSLFLIAGFLLACGGETTNTSPTDNNDQEEVEESGNSNPEPVGAVEPTQEEKGVNLYKNFTATFTGVMVLSLSNAFGGMAESMVEAFSDAEGAPEKVAEIDETINGLEGEVFEKMDELLAAFDEGFDRMKTDKPSVYDKMFGTGLMDEGIKVVEQADLPAGFTPITHDLTNEELKRYIVFLSQEDAPKDHPVQKMFEDLMPWFEKASAELNKDEEVVQYLQGMQN